MDVNMAKFKKGDRVKLIKEHFVFKLGQILTVGARCNDFLFCMGDDGLEFAVSENRLELLKEEKTMDNLEVGDILVYKISGIEVKILGKVGLVYFISLGNSFETFGEGVTIEELKEDYKLKEAPQQPKKMTVKEISEKLGHDVEVVKG